MADQVRQVRQWASFDREGSRRYLGEEGRRENGLEIFRLGGANTSKTRYDWWPYVKGMIRRYPALAEQYRDLHSPSMTADYSGIPRGHGENRSLETLAIRELPGTKQREYEAVRRAVAATERMRNGGDRLRVIRLVLWDRSHTLAGAALEIPCHYKTAQAWHSDFIRLVAAYYGLLDE